jgi:Uma2 family endonuclease
MHRTSILTEPSVPGEVFYPSGDGLPMAESGLHAVLFSILLLMLRNHFRTQKDVLVIGNIFIYYEKGNNAARRAPDLMVVKGVDGQRFPPSFKVWEENAMPCVVIELTSKSTAEEDLGPKKELYQKLGVREYFLFDPENEYLHRQLVGYRLVPLAEGNGDNGMEIRYEYDELTPAADGSLPSNELRLRLVPHGVELFLVDLVTGTRLLPPPEFDEEVAKYRLKSEQAEHRAEQAEHRAEVAEQRAEVAEQRTEQAEKDREETARLAEQAEKRRVEESRQKEEARRLAELAQKQRQEARQQRDEAQRRAERAETDLKELAERADKERRLREDLEAELARLRAALPPEPPAGTTDAP